MARDDASLVSGWNITPNVAYTLVIMPGAVSCGILLYNADGALLASGAALVGNDQPCVLNANGYNLGMLDADLGWHLLLTTTGSESQRTIRIGPAVDLPDEIHPVYGDDGLALARATAAIDAAAHYIDDVNATCPLGLGAGLGDVVSVPVDGVAVVGQIESITWTATPDGTTEQGVIRQHVAIAPEPYVAPLPLVVTMDTATTDAISTAQGNVLTNDEAGLTVTAVNGLMANVGVAVDGDNGGSFVINSDGSWTFDPDGDFAALDGSETASTSVTYYASDGTAEASATLVVTVAAVDTASSYYDEVMADSPALYWRLDETNGTTAVDSSGNGYDGTYGTGVTLGATPLVPDGNAITTFASSATAIVGVGSPDAISALSAEMWLKIASAPSSTKFPLGFSVTGYTAPWILFLNTNGTVTINLRYQNSGTGQVSVTSPSSICDNAKHQIGFAWDRNGDKILRLIIDGSVVAQSAAWDRNIYNADAYKVMAWEGSTIAGVTMDEVSIYLSGLSESRFAAHYSAAL
jgi:VCBS repeat-containing protein